LDKIVGGSERVWAKNEFTQADSTFEVDSINELRDCASRNILSFAKVLCWGAHSNDETIQARVQVKLVSFGGKDSWVDSSDGKWRCSSIAG